ncbi:MAG: spore germination protein [Firmicutes bacterium]|nr:spore germination protein [Bacillota bacterium]
MVKKNKGFFHKITSFLAYKPPQHNTFVLPELPDEESYRVPPEERKTASYGEKDQEGEQEQNQGAEEEKKKSKKKPVRAADWNKAKGDKEKEDKTGGTDEISPDINKSLEIMKKEFNIPANIDVVVREFKMARKVDAFIVFIDGMAARDVINDFILRQLMDPFQFEGYNGGCTFQYVIDNVLSVNQAKKIKKYKEAVIQVLMGVTTLFIDGCDSCLAIETRGYEKRNIDKPSTESVVRGSQEAFTENLKTSTTQIRRIVKNKDLIHEILNTGKTDHSTASVMYIKGIANPAVVKEVKRRINNIKTDAIFGDGILEHFIEDNPWMIIPQVLTTERPDRAASHLMEGKVVILAEGTPFAIVVPVTFHSLMQTPEDYFLRWQYGTALRLIRTLAFFMALLLPGLYVALTNYHQQMIPTDLLISISRSREVVPFPTVVEVLLMEISFELIREAGVRVPGIIGTTLGIIGALILGQAAVAANIVSPIMIIIVAVTGLGNFAIPNYSLGLGVRLLRFFYIFMGSVLGFFGISVGMVMVAATAVSMKSCGVPFLSPSWPKAAGAPDQIFRPPIMMQERRPDAVNALNKRRQPETARAWTRESPPDGKRE